jgi:hypothetical protein
MEFTNPPKSGREARTDKWREIVARLKEEPNEWAYVGEYSPGVAALIRQGTYPAFIDKDSALPAHSQMAMNWEVTTRKAKTAGRRTDLYIRYVG